MSKQRLPMHVDSDRPVTGKQSDLVDMILTTGQPIAKCAEELGRPIASLYRDLRKPHVKKYLQERTLAHMGVLAPYAAHVQQTLLSAQSESVRASVAENILDRHLGKPVTRSQVAIQGQISVVIDLG